MTHHRVEICCARCIAEFQQARLNCPDCPSKDQSHKMILLLEYLCRCGERRMAFPPRIPHFG